MHWDQRKIVEEISDNGNSDEEILNENSDDKKYGCDLW